MVCCVRCSKGFKICSVTAILLLILLAALLLVLFFTVFKPKDPHIILKSVKLQGFKLETPTLKLNVSLGIVVTVENPNHGSFTYHNSTAHLYHGETLVAEAPLHDDTIPARRDHNITTSLSIFADVAKLKDLSSDYSRGVINFTSSVTLLGKVKVVNLFKMKATSFCTCYISLFVPHKSIDSICNSKIKL